MMADISKIDMERINGLLDKLEEVSNNLNSMKHIIEEYHSGTQWYKIWSDGWIEQGGTFVASGDATINYPTPFANNWGEIRTLMVTPSSGNYGNFDFAAFEYNSASFKLVGSGWSGAVRINWFACGF